MITEQEAREAEKKRLIVAIGNGNDSIEARLLAAIVLEELDRREAERAERAKPIDAKWLKAIGSRCPKSKRWFILFERTYGPSRYETQLRAKMQPDGCYVIVTQGYGDDADDDDKEDVVSFACEFTTRGQMLDLLAALKGGASCESK